MRIIKCMENKYLLPSLDLVEDVFTEWDCEEEGKIVRRLVEEIRSLVMQCFPVFILRENMKMSCLYLPRLRSEQNCSGRIVLGKDYKLIHLFCLYLFIFESLYGIITKATQFNIFLSKHTVW